MIESSEQSLLLPTINKTNTETMDDSNKKRKWKTIKQIVGKYINTIIHNSMYRVDYTTFNSWSYNFDTF